MSLVESDFPAAAERACREVVSGLAATSSFRTPNLRRVDGRKLSFITPHRLTLLPLEAIQDDRRPAEPKEIGWRFLLRADAEPLAAAEALETSTGYRFGGLNEGPLISGFVEAVERAQRLSAIRDELFEPRLLLVPALNLAALWLSESGGARKTFAPRDMVLPLPPSDPTLPPYQAIGEEEFLAALRRLARRVPTGGAKGG